MHSRNRQRSKFTVLFRNENSSKRLGLVTPPFQHVDGFRSLLRGLPCDPVDSRSSLSLVGGDPPYGQNAGRQRADQDPLQGFHLARFPFPVRLRDTELEHPDTLAEPTDPPQLKEIRS